MLCKLVQPVGIGLLLLAVISQAAHLVRFRDSFILAPEQVKQLKDDIPQRCIDNTVTPVTCSNVIWISDDALLPHPDDCNLFYYCVTSNHKPICRACPADLHFNPIKHVCDEPNDAGCVLQPSSTPSTTRSPETESPTPEAITTPSPETEITPTPEDSSPSPEKLTPTTKESSPSPEYTPSEQPTNPPVTEQTTPTTSPETEIVVTINSDSNPAPDMVVTSLN